MHLAFVRSAYFVVREGMWTRCFPAMHKLRQIISSFEVGRIVYVTSDFGWAFPTNDLNDRVWMPSSGGITLDVGMYIAQLGRVAFPGGALKDVTASGTMKNGVDCSVVATISYDREQSADGDDVGEGFIQMTLTGEANTEERTVFQGTKGRIVLEGPSHVPQRIRVQTDEGRGESDEVVYDFPLPHDPYGEWSCPGSIGFTHEIAEVNRAVREGRLESESYTWEDSLEVAKIIDSILLQVRRDGDQANPQDDHAMSG